MRLRFLAAALTAFMAVPALAQAASGVATANVNMRSGPSTAYPAVVVIPVGSRLEIHGCLESPAWCDVSFARGRGWVSGNYIQATYGRDRFYVDRNYYQRLGIPVIRFNLDTYWDRHYRQRDFYRDRGDWRNGPDRRPPPPPRWSNDRRNDRDDRDWRQEPQRPERPDRPRWQDNGQNQQWGPNRPRPEPERIRPEPPRRDQQWQEPQRPQRPERPERPERPRPDRERPDQARPDQGRPDQARPDWPRPDRQRPEQQRPQRPERPERPAPQQPQPPLPPQQP